MTGTDLDEEAEDNEAEGGAEEGEEEEGAEEVRGAILYRGLYQ